MFWEELYIRSNKPNELEQYLHKFLALHHVLNIPQLGSFVIAQEPAQPDKASGLLFAPKYPIRFSEKETPLPETVFFDFLSTEMQVDTATAIHSFYVFCNNLRGTLEQKGIAVLEGIGRIIKREEELVFTPESNLLELLPPVAWTDTEQAVSPKQAQKARKEPLAETVVEEIEETETVKRDRWWIYVIVLALAGLLALLIRYQ
jgi:hypothetical protein